jgi:hypothetical protein
MPPILPARAPRRGDTIIGALQGPPIAELDEEEHVYALQPDRSDGEEVDREHGLCLCPQEGTPGESRTGAGRTSPAWNSSFFTVVAETVNPRPFSSPTIRW